jgi:hypothetical protein
MQSERLVQRLNGLFINLLVKPHQNQRKNHNFFDKIE